MILIIKEYFFLVYQGAFPQARACITVLHQHTRVIGKRKQACYESSHN